MLQVVTHNGKPPSEGGKWLGYLATDTVGLIWLPIIGGPTFAQVVDDWRLISEGRRPGTSPVQAESVQKLSVLRFADVSHYRMITGRCSNCFVPVAPSTGKQVETDLGSKTIYTCFGCGKKLRAFRDRDD